MRVGQVECIRSGLLPEREQCGAALANACANNVENQVSFVCIHARARTHLHTLVDAYISRRMRHIHIYTLVCAYLYWYGMYVYGRMRQGIE